MGGTAALIADQLAEKAPERSGWTAGQRDELVRQYLAVLDLQDWCATIRSDLDPDSDAYSWFAGNVAMRLQLRAFTDPTVDR